MLAKVTIVARAVFRRQYLDAQLHAVARESRSKPSECAAAGLTSCPVSKASEMASGEHATPARVQLLVESADQAIAAARAGGRRCNPVGMVIAGLGMSQAARGRPREVPLFLAQRWAESEATAVRMLEAQSAINARVRSARSSIAAGAASEGNACG